MIVRTETIKDYYTIAVHFTYRGKEKLLFHKLTQRDESYNGYSIPLQTTYWLVSDPSDATRFKTESDACNTMQKIAHIIIANNSTKLPKSVIKNKNFDHFKVVKIQLNAIYQINKYQYISNGF